MKPHLIIIGPPGSGKGTQASKLVQAGFKHLSTGDLLRHEIAKGSELGHKVSGILSKGDLVDDNTVMDLLKANCDVDNVSYIFDGFPRNIAQAKMLEEELLNTKKTLAIYFKVDPAILADRVVNRRICSNCGEIFNLITKAPQVANVCDKCGSTGTLAQRKDDTFDVVFNRLKIFSEAIEPMLSFYKSKGELVVVDASMKENEIYNMLENVIN
jgi:adenylate kinase